MKTKREQYSAKLDTKGEPVIFNGQQLLVTTSGKEVWCPAKAKLGKFIDYQIAEAGDTFVAAKQSSRTKLEGWLRANKGKDESDCPLSEEKREEPLYLENEIVPRTAGTVNFVGFSDDAAIAQEATLEERFAMAAKYGVTIKM